MILNVRSPQWPGKEEIVMTLKFEPSLEDDYDSGALKEGKILWTRVRLNERERGDVLTACGVTGSCI